MHIVEIRRVGDNNVIALPAELEAVGFTAGAAVVVEQTSDGLVMIALESRRRARITEIGRRVIDENREALDLLAAHDRGEADYVDGEIRRRVHDNP